MSITFQTAQHMLKMFSPNLLTRLRNERNYQILLSIRCSIFQNRYLILLKTDLGKITAIFLDTGGSPDRLQEAQVLALS